MVENVKLTEEAIAKLKQSRVIEAIKITRDANNLGLKEAKQHIEVYLKQHPEIEIQKPQLSQEFQLWLVIIVIGAAVLFWLF